MQKVTDVRNVIVIGGGPAGYTAALYAARANLEPLVIEGFNWGGQLMITSDVENYPGYADGVMGPTMMQDFRRQAERFGTTFITDDVTRVDFSQRPFRVWVGEDEHLADSVIIATGASARQLGLESELRLQGRGVSYCATCDAAFFRDKVVVVVGGGDSAMEEALFISRFASKVYLVHRRDEFRASPIMVDRARANEKIELVLNKVVDEVIGELKVTAVRLEDTVTGETSTLETDGLFVAIGHDPNTGLFLNQLDHEPGTGYLLTRGKTTETNIPGVFAAGDVRSGSSKRCATAVGEGSMAVQFVHAHLARTPTVQGAR
jgi:thioredoxin reductase (NADPH)